MKSLLSQVIHNMVNAKLEAAYRLAKLFSLKIREHQIAFKMYS